VGVLVQNNTGVLTLSLKIFIDVYEWASSTQPLFRMVAALDERLTVRGDYWLKFRFFNCHGLAIL